MPETYMVDNREYRINGIDNIKEALGFIKDWVTSIIQIQTAAIAAIGTFVGLSGFPKLSVVETLLIALTVICFTVSIINGGMLLHMLPGCVQRVPHNEPAQDADVYGMAPFGQGTIYRRANWFWYSFFAAIISFALFIIVRIIFARS